MNWLQGGETFLNGRYYGSGDSRRDHPLPLPFFALNEFALNTVFIIRVSVRHLWWSGCMLPR